MASFSQDVRDGRIYDMHQMLALHDTASTRQAASRIRKTMPQDIDFGVGRSIPSLPHTGRPLRPFFADNQDQDIEIDPAPQATTSSFLGNRRTPHGSLSMAGNSFGQSGSSSGAFQGVLSGMISPNDSPSASGLPGSGLSSRRRLNGELPPSAISEAPSLRTVRIPQTSISLGTNGPVSPTRELASTSRSDGASTWRRSIPQGTQSASIPLIPKDKDHFTSEKPASSGLPDGFGSGGSLLFTSPTKSRRLASGAPTAQTRQSPGKEREVDSLAALQVCSFLCREFDPDTFQPQTELRSPLVLKQEELVDNPLPSEYGSHGMQKPGTLHHKVTQDDPAALIKGVLGIGSDSPKSANNHSQPAHKPKSLFENVGQFDDLLGPRKPVAGLEIDPLIIDVRNRFDDPFASRSVHATNDAQPIKAISTPPGLPPPGFKPDDLLWTYKDPTGTVQGSSFSCTSQ